MEIIQVIKIVTILVFAAIILGTIGAMNLLEGVIVLGAVCFLTAGILAGVLIGVFISSIIVEGEE